MSAKYVVRYQNHMESVNWEKRRASYFLRYRKWCRVCKTQKRIHLHHHTYERFGRELDQDLVPLCEKHHDLVHRHHRAVGGSLTEATFRFIHEEQARIKSEQKRLDRVSDAHAKKSRSPREPRNAPGRSDPINNALGQLREKRRLTIRQWV